VLAQLRSELIEDHAPGSAMDFDNSTLTDDAS